MNDPRSDEHGSGLAIGSVRLSWHRPWAETDRQRTDSDLGGRHGIRHRGEIDFAHRIEPEGSPETGRQLGRPIRPVARRGSPVINRYGAGAHCLQRLIGIEVGLLGESLQAFFAREEIDATVVEDAVAAMPFHLLSPLDC